jgi:hypothetical protein
MSRDEEASLNVLAEDAKRRLCRGIESSKAVVAQYRRKLLAVRNSLEVGSGKRVLLPSPNRVTR